MFKKWKSDIDIYGPLKQAERCLDAWLKQENRRMAPKQKQRAAALIARYFYHEDELTDALIMSFLNHYSGKTMIDMDDPTFVRMEIKAVLDQSQVFDPERQLFKSRITGMTLGLLVVFAAAGMWELAHKTITKEQQAELRGMVHMIAEMDPSQSPATVWNDVKEPFNVSSYQQIKWWRFPEARQMLEKRLQVLKPRQPQNPSLLVGARM